MDVTMGSHGMDHDSKRSRYGRFLAVIGTSTVVMYCLMYLGTVAQIGLRSHSPLPRTALAYSHGMGCAESRETI